MQTTWLVLDVGFLCHRAYFSQTSQKMEWKGLPTGVVFHFLRSISALKDEFDTDNVVFCFDSPQLHRARIFPGYKSGRRIKQLTSEEIEGLRELHFQIDCLRDNYLPTVGFKNVLHQVGMESDDLMAKVCRTWLGDFVLVTSDNDLLQCLRRNVSIYNPSSRKFVTDGSFRKEHGIPPSWWADVKAIAGCSTDSVPGIKGVGEKTAVRYLLQQLKEESVAFQKIESEEGQSIYSRNLELVKLPFRGCRVPDPQVDRISKRGWVSVCSRLGLRSMAGHVPVASRKIAKPDSLFQ